MDDIKRWVLTVSAVSIISGVLISVLPKSSHKNLFKTITGILLIYSVINPIAGVNDIDFSIDDFLIDNYAVSENIDKYAIASMVDSAEKAIEDIMLQEAEKYNIKCKFICECEVEDEKISLVKITVSSKLSDESMRQIISIAESFGFDKNVIAFEGE